MHRRNFYNNEVHAAYAARFASELAGVLYDLSITHKELARELGVTHHTVDSWTRVADPKLPGKHNLQRLCTFLNTRKPGAGQKVSRASGMSDTDQPLAANTPPTTGSLTAPTRTEETWVESVQGNIPASLTGFIGRGAAITEVRRLLGETRLLTLTGAGGVGKTRLALEVVRHLPGLPDGVWLVELDALSDPNLIPAAIAQSLGISQSLGNEPLEALSAHIGEKRLLLVLDNCEHLIEACAQIVEKLLRECQNIRFLATSREALGCLGERAWVVPPLAIPPQADVLAGGVVPGNDITWLVEHHEAGQLFLARARERQPDFELTTQNAPHAVQICRKLDGIPLALELAAARVSGMSVEEIARRLDASLHLLTQGRRTSLPRQRALQASLDWSHNLLALPERMLFRRLGIFVGGWTLDAAEAVCAGEGLSTYGVLGNLMQLVDKSLVVVEQQEGGTRYRFLETIRQYALERLAESGETEALSRRHALFFAVLIERTSPMSSRNDFSAWANIILAEVDNLRAALSWALYDTPDQLREGNHNPHESDRAKAERAETGMRLVGVLHGFWSSRGETREGLDWVGKALALSDPSERTKTRAMLLYAAGGLAEQQGLFTAKAGHADRFQEAQNWLEESIDISRELGDKYGLANTLLTLGDIHLFEGDVETGRKLLYESLELAREVGNNFALIFTLFRLGDADIELGNLDMAHKYLQESLAVCRETGEKALGCLALTSMGRVAWLKGDYESAQTLGEEALAARTELGIEWPIAMSLNALADIVRSRGDYERAATLVGRSLAIFRKFDDVPNAAWSLYTQGHIAVGSGDYEQAIRLWAESLAMSQELNKTRDVGLCLAALAGAYYSTGRLKQAAALFGFVDSVLEHRYLPWPPNDRETYIRARSGTQNALGEELFGLEYTMGRAMQDDDVVAFAQSSASTLSG